MHKLIYELLYRFPFVTIDTIFGSTSDIESLVKVAIDGRIKPGRAITLGCGVGRETIYLAKHGFDATGVDFSPTAIKRAQSRAWDEGVTVKFVVDDLTDLQHVSGTYDLITDFGALNDLNQYARDLYVQNVLPLTHKGSQYLMFCFENRLPVEEVRDRFDKYFRIEKLDGKSGNGGPDSLDVYWMTRIGRSG